MSELISDSWDTFFEISDSPIKKLLGSIEFNEKTFPPKNQILRVLSMPVKEVRVVILGQDPYHKKGQAMGLSFSVNRGIKVPPSLRNIYKEVKREYPDFVIPKHGDLTNWFDQGVFLLNCALTVEESKPNSHAKLWEPITDNLIKFISDNSDFVVFLLWGAFAKSKSQFINKTKHKVFEWTHPSPLARAPFECNHFRNANEELKKKGLKEINWLNLN